jgi:uncharacterized membrane protein YbhN (UPF0104 family)
MDSELQLGAYKEMRLREKFRVLLPKKGRFFLSQVVVIGALVFLFCRLGSGWGEIRENITNINVFIVLLSFLPTLLMQILMSVGWVFLLNWFGCPLDFVQGFQLYYRASILRYLPGSFWYLPGRFHLCKQGGISSTAANGSMLLELFFLLLVGVWVGSYAIWYRISEMLAKVIIVVIAMVLLLLWIYPDLFVIFFDKIRFSRKRMLSAVLGYFLVWITYGISVLLIILGLGVSIESSGESLVYYISAVVVSWIAGFISLVPTGLGVREVSLAFMLVSIPDSSIFAATVMQRVIEMLLELILWGIAVLIHQYSIWSIDKQQMKCYPYH